MRTAAFAVLALLCLQAAAGFDFKPKYEPKKPVYEPKKPVIVKPDPPKPSPKPVVHTVTCTPKPVIVAAAANVTCGAGYTLSQTAYKKGYTCSKEVCVLVAPKPVYEPKKPVYSKGHYFFGKKMEEKKPVYEPKKPVYTPAPAPVYKPKPVPSPVPSPAPKPVCHIEYADPIYVCETGYTLQGKQCVLSTPGPCPPTYTASAGVCVYTFTKPVYEPKKPVYEPKKGHYFFGKKLDMFKKAPAPAGPSYCADSLYPKPSPVHKPKYEPKKPVYHPKKVEIDPKKIVGAVLSKFGKHD